MFSNDLSIDLGTANTLIYVREQGIVLNEPSIVAVAVNEGEADKAIAYGLEAKDMQGKTPGHIKIVRPIRKGVIADFDAIAAMLKFFIGKIHSRYKFVKPRIAFAVPHSITEVEKRAYRDSAEHAGAKEVHMIHACYSSAIGMGILFQKKDFILVDIGAAKIEITVFANSIAVGEGMNRIGVWKFKRAIKNYIFRVYSDFIICLANTIGDKSLLKLDHLLHLTHSTSRVLHHRPRASMEE